MEKAVEDVLMHYGILGMKWGKRRTPKEIAKSRHEIEAEAMNKFRKPYDPGLGLKYSPDKKYKHEIIMRPTTVDGVKGFWDINDDFYPGTKEEALAAKAKYENSKFEKMKSNVSAALDVMGDDAAKLKKNLATAKEVMGEDMSDALDEASSKLGGLIKKLKKEVNHSEEDQNALSHYGVLGMKWGVRKGSSKSSSKGTAKKKKPLKAMTDEELHKKVNRLNLEKRYKDLSPKQKSTGAAYVKKTLAKLGDQAIQRAGSTFVNAKVDEAMKKVLSD